MSQLPLFHPGERFTYEAYASWAPQEPPDLSAYDTVYFDTETTGLRWWAGDRPTGYAVATPDGRSWWLPVRQAGGNLDEDTVRRWLKHELRGKNITAFKTRFDLHMTRNDGVDLEEQGCTFSDVGHWAALLDERRTSTTLESVAQDYLQKGKVQGLDLTRGAGVYHAAEIAEYARMDVCLLVALREKMWPKMTEEGLHEVRALEDKCIPVTVEMEKNGAPLDREKLARWRHEAEQDLIAACWRIHKKTGLRIEPGSRADVAKLLAWCGEQVNTFTDKGAPSYTKDSMRGLKHESIADLREARAILSLRAKYLDPYWRALQRVGRLLYALHQMPIDNEGGTRSGRFSSSKYLLPDGDEEGANIQQVAGKKQLGSVKELVDLLKYVIRELFVPESGLWLSADAMQIEYRLFAHYAQPARVMAAYAENPRTDFHNFVWEMVKQVKADIERPQVKDLNFAKIYGAGLKQIAWMLGYRRRDAHPDSNEGLAETRPFVSAYDQAFPEAGKLLREAAEIAESRGYVRTLMGRRARFSAGDFFHPALNRVIQGTAAEENKKKLVELHKERKYTGLKLRFTVHDEACGDVPDVGAARRVEEVLNRQLLKTRVQLLWDVKVGANWKDCESIEHQLEHQRIEQVRRDMGQPTRRGQFR